MHSGICRCCLLAETQAGEIFQEDVLMTKADLVEKIAAKANLDALSQEYAESSAEVKKLEGQLAVNTKSLQNNADAVSKATTNLNLAQAELKATEAELKRLTQELYRQRYPAP